MVSATAAAGPTASEVPVGVPLTDIIPTSYELTDLSTHPEIEIAIEANLLSVNDLDDTFRVAILVHCLFFNGQTAKLNGKDEFQRCENYKGFVPHIQVNNITASQLPDFSKVFRINESTGEVWVAMYNTYTISESLEFAKFPFDRQIFRIKLKSNNSRLRPWKHDPILLEFQYPGDSQPEDLESATYFVFGAIKQWSIQGISVSYNPEKLDNVSLNQSMFTLGVKAERKPDFFFYQYCFIVYIIGTTNLAMLAVDPDTIIARNNVTVTLLLALISFKYIVIRDTPRINYLTYFDRYMRIAFMYVVACGIANIAFSTRFLCQVIGSSDKEGCDQEMLFDVLKTNMDNFDFYAQIGLWLLWTLLHTGIWIIVMYPGFVVNSWSAIRKGRRTTVQTSMHLTRNVYNELTRKREKIKVVVDGPAVPFKPRQRAISNNPLSRVVRMNILRGTNTRKKTNNNMIESRPNEDVEHNQFIVEDIIQGDV